MGTTLGSLRIDEPLHQRMRQQEILAELGACALRGDAADGLLQEATRLVALGLRTDFCMILEYQPAEDRFRIRAGVGWPPGAARPASVPSGLATTAGHAIRTGSPIMSDSFSGESRYPLARLLRLHGVRRAIDVVITTGTVPFGVIEAGSDAPGEFGAADVGFVQAAANLLAVALERTHTQAAVATWRTRTREVLESIGDLFCAVDREFRFIYLNHRAEEWIGRPRGDLIGKVIWDELPQMVGTETHAAYLRAAREHEVVHLETVGALHRRWLDISIYPSERGLAVYFRDIDERKRAEAALSESEARLHFATESAGIGTWEQDIATGHIVRSARHAAIYGVDPAEPWSHARFLSFVIPEDRAMADRIRDEAAEAGMEWSISCRIRRATDGAVRWVEARGAPMREASGGILRYVGILSDITERKVAEATQARLAVELERRVGERTRELADANARLTAEIAERQRAETALMQAQRLEAIGQLVGGVAHSFNNLLAAVIGNLELVSLGALGEKPRRLLDRALQSAWRGSALTHQLLAYARKQNLEQRPLDANAVLVGMRHLLGQTTGEGVRVETELAPGLWPALGDPAQLKTIILDLARNARDAMQAGGRLAIATRNFAEGEPELPPELPPGDYVLLTVIDDGCGMSADVLARACEPFFTTKEIGQGNGLGLAQVDGVARQFGGTVRLRSAPGMGTTVEVFLPRAEAAPVAAGIAAPLAGHDAGMV